MKWIEKLPQKSINKTMLVLIVILVRKKSRLQRKQMAVMTQNRAIFTVLLQSERSKKKKKENLYDCQSKTKSTINHKSTTLRKFGLVRSFK